MSTFPSVEEIEHKVYTTMGLEFLYPETEGAYLTSRKGSSERARAAFLMGVYFETRDFAKAKSFYDEADRIATKLEDPRLLSESRHVKAMVAFRAGDMRKAYRLEEHSLALATRAGHVVRVALCNYTLGILALRFGMSEDGLEYKLRALQLAQKIGYIQLQSRILSELSELSLIAGENSKAHAYAEQALCVTQGNTSNDNHASKQIRLATIKQALGKYAEVTSLISEVRKTLPPENHSLWCVTHTLMGKVHEAKRRYDKAEAEFREALKLADYVNAERVRSNVHTHLAELYLKTKRPNDALTEALAALADAETAQDAYVRKEALRCVHDCYKALEEYKEAHHYLERYNALVAESDTALLKNRLEYHALKSEYEQEKVKAEAQTKQSDLLRIKLDYKERELTEKIRHLLKQAEAVKQFRDDLRGLIRRSPANDPYVKTIRERLSSFTEDELNWQEFEKEFRDVHPEFLQALVSKYPELTQMEQRIAAMIRMDLKSYDIARLFCIAERTVEFHRLNLRKKLKLKKGEDLTKFLSSIG